VTNLIGNAIDAIGNTQDPWIAIKSAVTNEGIEISVTDSGKGIDASIAAKIMDPFFTTKEVGKGTGLGLSICVGILKDHGGDLVLNRNCANTQFKMIFPKNGAATSTDQVA